ncbi:MAG: HD-GYP domain-containing protein [Actinomycetota bacterium]
MSANVRAAALLAAGFVGSATLWLTGTDSGVPALVVLVGALAAGEMVLLTPSGRAPLPLSFAVMTVVATWPPRQGLVVLIVAEGVASIANSSLDGNRERLGRMTERVVEGSAAILGYQASHALALGRPRAVDLMAFSLAALAPVVVADAAEFVRHRSIAPLRNRSADLAIVSSGILMAVGYRGIAGEGRLGLWGPILFSIPLMAAWYSFQLLASTRKSLEQTVHALAAAPELGGLVRVGHSERVADLTVSMGRALSLSSSELEHLHTAALLHHLGAVCLDEPEEGIALDPVEVAMAGASMLRASEALAPAGDVVAAEPLLHRPPGAGDSSPAALSGMILKVASAYDELTEGDDEHAAWAVEALYTGPGYVYDGRVLGALERVLEARGALVSR